LRVGRLADAPNGVRHDGNGAELHAFSGALRLIHPAA
jgi:hypothetical protein